MSNDNKSQDQTSIASAMAVRQTALLEHEDGDWAGTPMYMTPQGGSPDLSVYLHALRRRWLLAAGVGLACGLLACLVVWFGYGAQYTASSLLQVSAQQKTIVSKFGNPADQRQFLYESYKNTQQGLVKSPLVLSAALRKPDVVSLGIDKREDDPVLWLSEELDVRFLGDTELMEVSLKSRSRQESKTLVEAVVQAYLTEVVEKERQGRLLRLNELNTVFSDKDADLSQKWSTLEGLARNYGTSKTETISIQQELAVKQLGTLRSELMRVKLDRRASEGRLSAHQALLQNIETAEVDSFQLDTYVRNDPRAKELSRELIYRQMESDHTGMHVRDGSREAGRYRANLDMVQQEWVELQRQLKEEVRATKKAEALEQVAIFQAEQQHMTAQETLLETDVENQEAEIERLGESYFDVERLRAEIDNLDAVLGSIAEEREILKVEMRATPRVTRLGSETELPESDVDLPIRITLTVLAALAAICIPVAGIAWWETRAERINTATDVSRRLGLTVMGSVPMIPARAIGQLSSAADRGQGWGLRLTESVDGIAARLLHKAELDKTRVVLVTSASGGEGKTTLASQLASSLARTGRRTVLVDFDLRNPSFDEVFGLPLVPGISEILRGESGLTELAHPTGTSNLSVATSGRWDRRALAALANGAAGPIMDKLRGEYDFVVVDASPVLPVADTRFVSQHVDTVILSVFRDVSQAPKVQAACEILEAFGVHSLEAVVTGQTEMLRDEDMNYASQIEG